MADSATDPILRVDRLSYRYPNGNLALDGVDFAVQRGEVLGIVGPSGAGKSTLLLHLNGLLPRKLPSSRGANSSPVHVAGAPVAADRLPEIRRMVGLLVQDPVDQRFCPTVREDVAFGPLNLGLPADEIARRVVESLAAVGLDDFAHRSTVQLSVGERKRVCLAGVLACRPEILALDEPTGNLDPRARRTLLEILSAFGGTQVIATHDLDLVISHCSRVIVLDGGRVYADGRPRDILADSVLMERHGLEVPLRLRLGG
jgi:energy-coupling factor transporter ATP-binding protein EcfA2